MRPVARIAQSVEQGIENPRVGSSILSPGTTSFRGCSLRVEKLNGHDNGNQESIVHLCISR